MTALTSLLCPLPFKGRAGVGMVLTLRVHLRHIKPIPTQTHPFKRRASRRGLGP